MNKIPIRRFYNIILKSVEKRRRERARFGARNEKFSLKLPNGKHGNNFIPKAYIRRMRHEKSRREILPPAFS